jgi:hypothetical protein
MFIFHEKFQAFLFFHFLFAYLDSIWYISEGLQYLNAWRFVWFVYILTVQTFWFSLLPQDEFGTAFPFFKKKKKKGRKEEK